MTKKQAIKKIESTLKKTMGGLVKEINGILTEAGMWYSTDDIIKSRPEFRKLKDRNADQLVIDIATDIVSGASAVIPSLREKDLWTKQEIEA